ncbi:MAG: glutaredoxin family protein [Dehalococcoidales bacterium]|nr:glutaredoxin family protein [Dehalococcoidales bacterium]
MKEYLSQKKVTFTEYNVAEDKDKAREMVEKSKQMGVPVVMVDDDIIVGFNQAELEKLLA